MMRAPQTSSAAKFSLEKAAQGLSYDKVSLPKSLSIFNVITLLAVSILAAIISLGISILFPSSLLASCVLPLATFILILLTTYLLIQANLCQIRRTLNLEKKEQELSQLQKNLVQELSILCQKSLQKNISNHDYALSIRRDLQLVSSVGNSVVTAEKQCLRSLQNLFSEKSLIFQKIQEESGSILDLLKKNKEFLKNYGTLVESLNKCGVALSSNLSLEVRETMEEIQSSLSFLQKISRTSFDVNLSKMNLQELKNKLVSIQANLADKTRKTSQLKNKLLQTSSHLTNLSASSHNSLIDESKNILTIISSQFRQVSNHVNTLQEQISQLSECRSSSSNRSSS